MSQNGSGAPLVCFWPAEIHSCGRTYCKVNNFYANKLRNQIQTQVAWIMTIFSICFYCFIGSMGDFNYIYSNCFELTIALSCCKYPKAELLDKEWDKNKEALMSFIEQVLSIFISFFPFFFLSFLLEPGIVLYWSLLLFLPMNINLQRVSY